MCGNCNTNTIVIPSPSQAVHGIASLTQLAFQPSTHATEEVITARRDVCRECPEATRSEKYRNKPSKGLTNLSQCRLCACLIKYKTMAKEEKCPAGKWQE